MRSGAALAIVAWLAGAGAWGAALERVQVVDPYLELHTGPGRGYPVFNVVERGEWIEILMRKTDWFKVRTAKGTEGWAARAQLEKTLTGAGVRRTFRDVLLEDYLRRRFEVGFAGGVLESDPLMLARFGYKLTDNLSVELVYGQASGDFSSTTLYYAAISSEPFADWRWSPFFTLGVGGYENTPRATLVGAVTEKDSVANVGLGVRFYMTRRFVFRLDAKNHVFFVDENRTESFQELSMGFSFFF